jgi:hypothetical protein
MTPLAEALERRDGGAVVIGTERNGRGLDVGHEVLQAHSSRRAEPRRQHGACFDEDRSTDPDELRGAQGANDAWMLRFPKDDVQERRGVDDHTPSGP